MSEEPQEFTVKEVLQFIHDSIRFMRAGSLDQNWAGKDPSELMLCTASFRAQPIVRLIHNIVLQSAAENSGSSNPSELGDVVKLLQQSFNIKLDWLADQGVFDPLLPWIGSIVADNRGAIARLSLREVSKPTKNVDDQVIEDDLTGTITDDEVLKINTNEVTIHVVDDVRGGHKDFSLPANILLDKMPYFAKATRGQFLSDVDITVHCDCNIFEWLTKWMNSSPPPPLLPSNVVPVLLSAAFLETEQLVEECLDFCHKHTSQILDAKQSFSCLSDQLIERLASKFTSTEVEQLGHQRSSLQSRLYAWLIVDLCSSKTYPKRGIFKTASTLFQCSFCGNLLTDDNQLKIPCTAGRVMLTKTGQVMYRHQRDETWNLTEYVQNLKITLKSWRRVYWRLWSHVHFLDCGTCSLPFPASDYLKCPFHAELPIFMGANRNKSNFQPIGKFACCQQPAFRFALIPNRHGCKMKEHTVCCLNLEHIQVMTMCRQFPELIHINGIESPNVKLNQQATPDSSVKSIRNEDEIVPRFSFGLLSRPRKHLVPLPWQPEPRENSITKDNNRPKTACSSSQDSLSTTGSAESDDKSRKLLNVLEPHALCEYEDDEDLHEDEVEDVLSSSHMPNKSSLVAGRDGLKRTSHPQLLGMRRKFAARREIKMKPQPTTKEVDLRWNPCLSSRSNQDSQRYMEEDIFRRIIIVLTPSQWQKPRTPAGGLFAKLQRMLQEKIQKESRQTKLASSVGRSITTAMTAALAARKFKAQLSTTSTNT